MANAAGLEVRESGRALRFHTETPHLVSTGSGRLSTTVTLHPLPEGRIVVGSSREADIQLGGSGVEFIHCIIENAGGSVTLHPLSGSTCVDGHQLASPQRLTQGCMLTIGHSNYLRFNHPAEAKQLKRSNSRNSPMTYNGTNGSNGCSNGVATPEHQHHQSLQVMDRKPPVAPPHRSPRGSSCSDDEVNFLGKLSKFEMLARQARANCVSPKVFPSGSLTTNVPADQILGHSRSSSLASLGAARSGAPSPFQNLTNSMDRCGHNNEEHQVNGMQQTQQQQQSNSMATMNRNLSTNQNAIYANVGQCNRNGELQHYQYNHHHQHHHQQQQHQHQTHPKGWPQHPQQRSHSQEMDYSNDENRNNVIANGYANDIMSRSFTCQRSCDLNQFSRDFDMSQSLIVAKTTTCTEFLQLEKFDSNSTVCHRRADSYDSQNAMSTSPNSRRPLQAPSPAFNREPLYGRIRSPAVPVAAPCVGGCSREDLLGRGHHQEERQREQELEKMRLEEILNVCAEYERQSCGNLSTPATRDNRRPPQPLPPPPHRPQHQYNGVSSTPPVNGSLPRNPRRQFAGRPKTPPVPPERNSPQHHQHQSISPIIENFVSSNSTTPVEEDHLVETPNNNRAPKWPENHQQNGLPDSSCANMSITEEVVKNESLHRPDATPDVPNGSPATSSAQEPRQPTTNSSTMSKTTTTTAATATQERGRTINCQTLLSGHNYENFAPVNGKLSVYENVILNQAPTTTTLANNRSLPRSPKRRDACEMIDNKLDVSNDDLLEAIEQLSMLSRPRSLGASVTICNGDGGMDERMTTSMTADMMVEPPTTPKKINCERDNAKSNEAKADKERRELEEEDRKKYVEFLQNEKQHILGNMDGFKRSVADIETQEDEIHRELELEKALLSAEYESESLKLEQDEAERDRVQARTAELECELQESKAVQAQLQSEARQRVSLAQQACATLEQELADASGRDDERDSELADKLAASSETLETERKAFEDLEFHHLEQEASRLAARDELQRYLGELSTKIESRKLQLSQLETQRTDIQYAVTKEAKSLERQKLAHLRRLEEGRNRLRAIDDELEGLAKNVADNPDEKRSPSREDFDRISRVTTDSPIVNNQGSLGRKTIESLKEIERNRQMHLAKQGSQVISEERRRVEELKRRVQDEVRSQWEERKMNCTSFNSVESGEESSSYSTGPTESGSGSSDGAENGTGEKLSPGKLSEFTTPSPGPSGNSYTLLQSDNVRDDRPTSMETERFNGNGSAITDETESRPLSQTSSELESLSPLQVKHRDKPRLQRPLTRYLPIKSESLDLRYHIETAGHQLPLIHDVTVDTTSCSGYLSKMSKKFHHWNKRWFVFDRKRKTLSYYGDNNSKKPRGVVYFQSIEEVYVDHMNTVKSPQPSLTFIVKTTTRLYHLMAPSSEAMRVWVDVVFTGAEGYHEFDPNS